MPNISRCRCFLAGFSDSVAAGLVGSAQPAYAELPPEVPRLRLPKIPSVCMAAQDVAEELRHSQGSRSLSDKPRHGRAASRRGKFTANYDYALQVLGEVPYKRRRYYNVEDSVRSYALRLHEAGTITTSPQEIIAKSTDWRFLEELKQELKT